MWALTISYYKGILNSILDQMIVNPLHCGVADLVYY